MKIKKSSIPGAFLITPTPFSDGRGEFMRIFCTKEFAKNKIKFSIVQTNLSTTIKRGTIRGIHFQKKPKQEDKIIQCIKGKIFDVVLDLRKNSPTYKKWESVQLSESTKQLLLIPGGCAHGFQTLTRNCLLLYFMSEYYDPACSSGVRWNDPNFNIQWPIRFPTLSQKDKMWPLFKTTR